MVPTYAGEQESTDVTEVAIGDSVDEVDSLSEGWKSLTLIPTNMTALPGSYLTIRIAVMEIGSGIVLWEQGTLLFRGRHLGLEADAGCRRGQVGKKGDSTLDIPSHNKKH